MIGFSCLPFRTAPFSPGKIRSTIHVLGDGHSLLRRVSGFASWIGVFSGFFLRGVRFLVHLEFTSINFARQTSP